MINDFSNSKKKVHFTFTGFLNLKIILRYIMIFKLQWVRHLTKNLFLLDGTLRVIEKFWDLDM